MGDDARIEARDLKLEVRVSSIYIRDSIRGSTTTNVNLNCAVSRRRCQRRCLRKWGRSKPRKRLLTFRSVKWMNLLLPTPLFSERRQDSGICAVRCGSSLMPQDNSGQRVPWLEKLEVYSRALPHNMAGRN